MTELTIYSSAGDVVYPAGATAEASVSELIKTCIGTEPRVDVVLDGETIYHRFHAGTEREQDHYAHYIPQDGTDAFAALSNAMRDFWAGNVRQTVAEPDAANWPGWIDTLAGVKAELPSEFHRARFIGALSESRAAAPKFGATTREAALKAAKAVYGANRRVVIGEHVEPEPLDADIAFQYGNAYKPLEPLNDSAEEVVTKARDEAAGGLSRVIGAGHALVTGISEAPERVASLPERIRAATTSLEREEYIEQLNSTVKALSTFEQAPLALRLRLLRDVRISVGRQQRPNALSSNGGADVESIRQMDASISTDGGSRHQSADREAHPEVSCVTSEWQPHSDLHQHWETVSSASVSGPPSKNTSQAPLGEESTSPANEPTTASSDWLEELLALVEQFDDIRTSYERNHRLSKYDRIRIRRAVRGEIGAQTARINDELFSEHVAGVRGTVKELSSATDRSSGAVRREIAGRLLTRRDCIRGTLHVSARRFWLGFKLIMILFVVGLALSLAQGVEIPGSRIVWEYPIGLRQLLPII